MSTLRSSPARSERDPDVAGAETALHRAARRAMERAEKEAGIAVREKSSDKAGSVRETRVSRDPRQISFSQAQGYEEIPGPLKLEELPENARTGIWNVFFASMKQVLRSVNRVRSRRIVRLGDEWHDVLRAMHTDFHNLPLDEWIADFEHNRSELRHYIETQPFNKVFDLIQFALRHPKCPRGFIKDIRNTFAECRLAYTIDAGPPATVLPAVTPEEGDALVESLQALRDAAMGGSATHLRKAAEHVNTGDWADSVRESTHAVESVARTLDPAATTLKPALAALEKRSALHPALKGAFSKLYGYTSDEQGVRHALLDQPQAKVGRDEAVFMLGACASFASYLWRKHAAGASS